MPLQLFLPRVFEHRILTGVYTVGILGNLCSTLFQTLHSFGGPARIQLPVWYASLFFFARKYAQAHVEAGTQQFADDT